MKLELMPIVLSIVAATTTVFCQSTAGGEETLSLPKLVLIGDSIRLSYEPVVAKQLEGRFVVVGPKVCRGDSEKVLANLEKWIIRGKPDIVHFNYGIYDTKKFHSTGRFQVSPESYEANVHKIVERILRETDAVLLPATITPIFDERAANLRKDRDFKLLGESVEKYNAITKKVMTKLKNPVYDLHARITESDPRHILDTLVSSDGVHLTESGKELLGKRVASFVVEQYLNSSK